MPCVPNHCLPLRVLISQVSGILTHHFISLGEFDDPGSEGIGVLDEVVPGYAAIGVDLRSPDFHILGPLLSFFLARLSHFVLVRQELLHLLDFLELLESILVVQDGGLDRSLVPRTDVSLS